MTAGPVPSSPAPPRRRPRRFTVGAAVAAFAAVALVAVLVIAAAVVWVARRDATTSAVQDARDVTVAQAHAAVEPALTDGLLTGDAASLTAVDRVVRTLVLNDRVVRVKVWAPDGSILYSDDPALIGRRYALGTEEQQALATGSANAEVSNLAHPENVDERQFHKLLEVYYGVHTVSGTPVLYEAYLRFSSVSHASDRTLRSMLPALVLGLALLFLVQVPLAWSLARRVERSRAQEERLLRRALAAGEVERRHIAADLHDGVVQSLVGTSLALSATAGDAARAGLEDVAAKVNEAAAGLRQGVRDLRSLIVAIAPPLLHEQGLEAALTDLVSPLASRGIHATLRVEDVQLEPATETLLYRAAQEALRNVARHARATSVDVAVEQHRGGVRLVVEDNGVGFRPSGRGGPPQHEGHVGLRLLAELASEAGGRLDVTAAPGEGTTLCLQVPA